MQQPAIRIIGASGGSETNCTKCVVGLCRHSIQILTASSVFEQIAPLFLFGKLGNCFTIYFYRKSLSARYYLKDHYDQLVILLYRCNDFYWHKRLYSIKLFTVKNYVCNVVSIFQKGCAYGSESDEAKKCHSYHV